MNDKGSDRSLGQNWVRPDSKTRCTGEMDEDERAGPLTSETARKVKLVFAGTLCCIFLEQRHRRTMIKGLGAAIVLGGGSRSLLMKGKREKLCIEWRENCEP